VLNFLALDVTSPGSKLVIEKSTKGNMAYVV